MTDPLRNNGGEPPDSRPTTIRWLEIAELIVGALLLVMIFALMLIQAVQRHLPVESWVWVGELARYGLVWLAFSLAGYLVGRDEHITLKLVDFVARGRVMRAVWILSNLVVAATCAFFALGAADQVFGPSPQTTPVLGIPLTWTYVIPMVGLTLAALRGLANAALLPGPPEPEVPLTA
ncbi:TRAP transporter small permease, partial [Nocardiopsis sp. MG754419]|uniref:TRAP transporter small permease n=1 Tax=Nocardiopsis sp. MG754419 TaxID=2259865 RepID=UPI001BA964CA